MLLTPPPPSDRVLLPDQPVSRRHRHAVLGDEETRDGAHEDGACSVPLDEHSGVGLHVGTELVLRRDHQVHRPPVQTSETEVVLPLQTVPPPPPI